MPFGFLKRRKQDGAPATGGPSGADPGAASPRLHGGPVRGVQFTALTEDWRLRGWMDIQGRLSDALNKREAIAIHDVSWGPPESGEMEPALKVHKVAYDVALEVPPFRVVGTVYLHPGSEPDRLLDRSSEMFVAVSEASARLGDIEVADPEVEVILVNRFYLRGVTQVDKRTGEPHQKLPGSPLGGISWQDRS